MFVWHASTDISRSGHVNLDRDHEILIAILERLQVPNVDKDGLTVLAAQFLAYLDAHFEHEEDLMTRYEYPLAPAHKEAHQEMRVQAERLVAACVVRREAVPELISSIELWIESHMRGVDAQFAAFLNGHDVEHPDADVKVFPT